MLSQPKFSRSSSIAQVHSDLAIMQKGLRNKARQNSMSVIDYRLQKQVFPPPKRVSLPDIIPEMKINTFKMQSRVNINPMRLPERLAAPSRDLKPI